MSDALVNDGSATPSSKREHNNFPSFFALHLGMILYIVRKYCLPDVVMQIVVVFSNKTNADILSVLSGSVIVVAGMKYLNIK